MQGFFHIVTALNASFYKDSDRLDGVFEDVDDFLEHDLLNDEIIGACSFLLNGIPPSDFGRRLRALQNGLPLLRTLDQTAQPKCSPRGRHAYFVIMLHAWVIQHLRCTDEIEMIPRRTAEFEATDVGFLSFVMQDLESKEFQSFAPNFEPAFLECKDVVAQALTGQVTHAKFDKSRTVFLELQPLFDSVWTNDAPSVALRGYLAAIGLCLSWLDNRGEAHS